MRLDDFTDNHLLDRTIAALVSATLQQQVVPIGRLPGTPLSTWPSRVTDEIVLIKNRRDHYLSRHPELRAIEKEVLRTVLDPDHVHANARDARMAILYRRVDGDHHMRVALWVSDISDRQNSILSARPASNLELIQGEALGRGRWKK